MPVFFQHRGPILRIVADGDYTPQELRRVGKKAIEAKETSRPVRVLLDMSGATSLRTRKPADLRETARFFSALGKVIHRIAILAGDDLSFGLMRMGAAFGEVEGLDIEVFRTPADAMAWLSEGLSEEAAQ